MLVPLEGVWLVLFEAIVAIFVWLMQRGVPQETITRWLAEWFILP